MTPFYSTSLIDGIHAMEL